MMNRKFSLAFSLTLFGTALMACGPFFPPSFIDDEEAAIIGVQEKELIYHLKLLSEHFMPDAAVIPPSPRSAEKDPPPPRLEYQLYEEGVKEITADPELCFPKAWKKLLQLPPSERRYRTVRTLYMLGNLALRNKEDDRSAWKFYHALRKAVREEGYPDNLGLSCDTFQALYRYSAAPGQLRYLPLAARFNASKISYRTELKEIVQRMTAVERSAALEDPYLAELLLLADPGIVKSSPHKFLLADRLAMRAYQKGNFLLCADLLKQAPDDSLIKLFLQARFARFSGDVKRASALLHRWLQRSQKALAETPQYVFTRTNASTGVTDDGFEWKREVYGQLGLVSLEEKDYEEALLAFLKADSWADASLVAEQYLSTEALRKFVDAHRLAAHLKDPVREDELKIEVKLCHLLARALLRRGDVAASIPYFPESCRKVMAAYEKNWRISRDPNAVREERARAFFRLGQIQMTYNIALLGFEQAPDYYVCRGSYNVYSPFKMQKKSGLPRYHYRRTIADTYRQAAELSTDEELKFAALLAAGWTLFDQSPKDADPYYKTLCQMKLEPLSSLLKRHKWFFRPGKQWRERFFKLDPADHANLHAFLEELKSAWAGNGGEVKTF